MWSGKWSPCVEFVCISDSWWTVTRSTATLKIEICFRTHSIVHPSGRLYVSDLNCATECWICLLLFAVSVYWDRLTASSAVNIRCLNCIVPGGAVCTAVRSLALVVYTLEMHWSWYWYSCQLLASLYKCLMFMSNALKCDIFLRAKAATAFSAS